MTKDLLLRKKPLGYIRNCVRFVRELFLEEYGVLGEDKITLKRKGDWWPYGFIRPIRKVMPIYLGAVKPRMTRLAGEIGDGILLELWKPLFYVKESLRYLREGAEKAGRNPDDVDTAMLMHISVSEDGIVDEGTRMFVARRISNLDEKSLKAFGFGTDTIKKVKKIYAKNGLRKASKFVSKRMVQSYTIAGTPTECIKLIEEYVAAGIKLPILFPLGCDMELAIETGSRFSNRN